jgi:hypothetical protein
VEGVPEGGVVKTRKDPKDYGPMWCVAGPLASYAAGTHWRFFRSAERAARYAARLNARQPGHRVTAGIGGRAGWRSTEVAS